MTRPTRVDPPVLDALMVLRPARHLNAPLHISIRPDAINGQVLIRQNRSEKVAGLWA